jgi:hypothetical protein
VAEVQKAKAKLKKPQSLKHVIMRNGFFWVQYKSLIAANIIAAAILFIGLIALWRFATFEPPHKYIPTTPDFKVLVSPPLNEEFAQDGDVIQVATSGLRGVYTYDFVNKIQQIGSAEKYFTASGWSAFIKELNASGAIKAVEQKHQVASIRIESAPFIKGKGLLNGVYTWAVEFPRVVVLYQSGNEKENALIFNYSFSMEVARTSLEQSQKGVAIDAIRAKEVK